MNILTPVVGVSPLRQRLIDEMEIRRFGRDTQRNYIRDVNRFATWLQRSPDTAMAEEVRRFQVEQRDLGVTAPTMNSIVAALRFFFTCGSAWKKDPDSGVIGVEKGPLIPVV